MKFGNLLRSVRVFCLTFLFGLSTVSLGTLAAHFGLDANRLSSENSDLKEQVRGLVGHIAELEGLLQAVGKEREQVEAVTLSTLATVIETTTLEPEKQGQLYLASLTPEQREGAPIPVKPQGPPMSAAATTVILERTTAMRGRAESLLKDLRETRRLVGLRSDVLAAIPSILPAKGWLSSEFGVRESPFHAGESMHLGLDIAADEGTPVFAPADGVIQFAGNNGSYGKFIRIGHGFGITTAYGHNAEIMVKRGQKVHRGEQIAMIGSTGRSTGPHVHYEVRVHGNPVDPARYLFDGSSALTPPTTLRASTTATQFRPMGGESEVDLDQEREESVVSATGPGLLPWTKGERIFVASILPTPLGRTTTTDLILFVALLLLLVISGSLARIPNAAPLSAAPSESVAARPRPQVFELGVWAGRSADEEPD